MDGTHVPVGAQVEQVEVDARRGALRSRLHARGLVTSRGTTRLVVRFEGEEETVSIRPHLVRVVQVSVEEHHRAVAGFVARGPDHDHAQWDPPGRTGDPWIDAYLTFRRAWLDGASEGDLADLATECRRGLPSPAPPAPAAMFIHRDILITCGQKALPPQLVTALWVPDSACLR